jgi:hypothetical protein
MQLSSLMSLTCISIFHIGATTAKESDETHNAIVRRSGYIIPPETERERGGRAALQGIPRPHAATAMLHTYSAVHYCELAARIISIHVREYYA